VICPRLTVGMVFLFAVACGVLVPFEIENIYAQDALQEKIDEVQRREADVRRDQMRQFYQDLLGTEVVARRAEIKSDALAEKVNKISKWTDGVDVLWTYFRWIVGILAAVGGWVFYTGWRFSRPYAVACKAWILGLRAEIKRLQEFVIESRRDTAELKASVQRSSEESALWREVADQNFASIRASIAQHADLIMGLMPEAPRAGEGD
jgi:hypothetical protein